jgi:hypothetical protein
MRRQTTTNNYSRDLPRAQGIRFGSAYQSGMRRRSMPDC